MIETLTADGYEQTREKLRDLETRLAAIERRTDLKPDHLESVRKSYRMMMRDMLKEVKLYESMLRRTVRLPTAD